MSSTSNAVGNQNDEDCVDKEKAFLLEHGYGVPVTLDDTECRFIGFWEGSFTIKNAKNGTQQIDESFFIYGIAGSEGGKNLKLSELPSEPISALFKCKKSISEALLYSSEIHFPASDNSSIGMAAVSHHESRVNTMDVTGSGSSLTEPSAYRKLLQHDKTHHSIQMTEENEIHLVGFGRNKYGRFSLYVVYDGRSQLMRCEKKYVTSKYKGLKRGRKPLSYHASSYNEIDEHHRMTTRPRMPIENFKNFASGVHDNGISELVINSKKRRPSNKSKNSALLSNAINCSPRLSPSSLGLRFSSDEINPKSRYDADVGIDDDVDPTYKHTFFDDDTGEIYEGGWMDGKRDGKGICLFANGLIYEGLWASGVEMGFGQLMTTDRRLLYSGEWMDGLTHGHGTYTFSNGDKYIGDWKEGARHGKGDYIWANGCKYAGEWKENCRHGKGIFTWDDEHSFYDGEWHNDMRHGKGLLIAQNGFRYDGYWHQNFFEGKGVTVFLNGQEYQGSFKQGLREGRGSIRFSVGGEYEGRFKEDHMDGQGTIKLSQTVPGIEEEEHMIPIQIQADIKRIHYRAGFVDDLH